VSCPQAFENDRGARYVGGELAEEERDAFEQHFLDCPDCLAAMQALGELPAVLREPGVVPRAPAARLPGVGATWAWAAAVLVAIGSGFLLGGRWAVPPTEVMRGTGPQPGGMAIDAVRELSPSTATVLPRGVVLLVVPVPPPAVGGRVDLVLHDDAGSKALELSRLAVDEGRARVVVDATRLQPGSWRLDVQRLGPQGRVEDEIHFALELR